MNWHTIAIQALILPSCPISFLKNHFLHVCKRISLHVVKTFAFRVIIVLNSHNYVDSFWYELCLRLNLKKEMINVFFGMLWDGKFIIDHANFRDLVHPQNDSQCRKDQEKYSDVEKPSQTANQITVVCLTL